MAFCFAKNRLFRVTLSLHSFAPLRNWLRQPLQSLPQFKIKKLEIEPNNKFATQTLSKIKPRNFSGFILHLLLKHRVSGEPGWRVSKFMKFRARNKLGDKNYTDVIFITPPLISVIAAFKRFCEHYFVIQIFSKVSSNWFRFLFQSFNSRFKKSYISCIF